MGQVNALWQRYMDLAHSVQSAVGWLLERDAKSGTPKHLRTGLDVTKCEQAALVNLLVDRGIITEEEYVRGINEMLEKEVQRHEAEAERHFGLKVTFR